RTVLAVIDAVITGFARLFIHGAVTAERANAAFQRAPTVARFGIVDAVVTLFELGVDVTVSADWRQHATGGTRVVSVVTPNTAIDTVVASLFGLLLTISTEGAELASACGASAVLRG